MEEQSTRAQESARQAQESARQAQESATRRQQQQAREAVKDTTRVAGQLAGLGTETLTVWTDAAQHAARDVLELSTQAAHERARMLTEWQQASLEMMREMQTATFHWYTLWPEFLRDPIRGYQRSLEDSIETSHRVLALARRQAETLAQSCQRLERAADDTTKTLGETFKEASTKMQDVYARTDRLRAA
jgi:hypothetical protein